MHGCTIVFGLLKLYFLFNNFLQTCFQNLLKDKTVDYRDISEMTCQVHFRDGAYWTKDVTFKNFLKTEASILSFLNAYLEINKIQLSLRM